MSPKRDRWYWRLGVCVLGLAVAAGVVGALRRPIRTLRLDLAIHDAIRFIDRDGLAGVPLAYEEGSFVRACSIFVPPGASRFDSASRLLEAVEGIHTDRADYARGVASLAAGSPDEALRRFESIPVQRRSSSDWAGLAAAHAFAGSASSDYEHLVGGLVAAERALDLDHQCSAVKYIRAVLFARMGLTAAAVREWQEYLDSSTEGKWRTEASRRLRQLRGSVDDAEAWDRGSGGDLAVLTGGRPQQARTHAEAIYICDWGAAIERGDTNGAAAELQRLRIIGESLRAHSGESLVADAVRSISTAEPSVLRVHTRALALYQAGRIALHEKNPAGALPLLSEAGRLFRSVNNPMAALTECYTGIALIDHNRLAEARRRLAALIEEERRPTSGHHALRAFALYHLALCDASAGNWNGAIAAADESSAIFTRLGERANAGMCEALISETWDFLGQQQPAWQHGLKATALLMAGGDRVRARAFLAGLSHAEIRNRRWDFAKVLAASEQTIVLPKPQPHLDCDTFLRTAVADDRLGHPERASRSLALARQSAERVEAGPVRTKLLADVAATAGALMRRTAPAQAIPLLSQSIAFQESAERPVLLPQLYLERGRAYLATGRSGDAASDFERGIVLLERQRTQTAMPLRGGIFDDSGELFEEAVSLAVSRNDAAAAFAYVERGRARTMFEEMSSRQSGSIVVPAPVSAAALAPELPKDRLLLEFEVLDGEVVVLSVDRSGAAVARVAVPRQLLEQKIAAFVEALIARKPEGEIAMASQRLYSWLLGPVAGRIAAVRSLVIVPDATLQQLPFAALMSPATGKYLMQTHVLLWSPSAAVYRASSDRAARQSGARVSAAIFANPSLHGSSFDTLPPLRASEIEGGRVAKLYPERIFLHGADVTPARFEGLASSHEVVHFAGHAVIRPRQPWTSALLLAGAGDEGLLTVPRISRMTFRRTRLVVLAACSTTQGAGSDVEGASSLARAFLVAGVPSVVATLWDVEDGESGALVQALHRNFSRGASPAEALRNAQLEALRSRSAAMRHPGYWSAFALIGASS